MKASLAVLIVLVVVVSATNAKKQFNKEAVAENKNKALQKVSPLSDTNDVTRTKRQYYYYYYYLCGTYPSQYYSYYPCTNSVTSSAASNLCSNGGSKVGFGCSTTAECANLYNGISVCLSNCCCSVPL